jgi:transcriptional regulator with XRE-family HTH domain
MRIKKKYLSASSSARFFRKISKIKIQSGVTWKKIAAEVGLTEQAIHRYRSGKRRLFVGTAKAISRYCGWDFNCRVIVPQRIQALQGLRNLSRKKVSRFQFSEAVFHFYSLILSSSNKREFTVMLINSERASITKTQDKSKNPCFISINVDPETKNIEVTFGERKNCETPFGLDDYREIRRENLTAGFAAKVVRAFLDWNSLEEKDCMDIV